MARLGPPDYPVLVGIIENIKHAIACYTEPPQACWKLNSLHGPFFTILFHSEVSRICKSTSASQHWIIRQIILCIIYPLDMYDLELWLHYEPTQEWGACAKKR